jgi:hypothetical protein
VIRTHCPLCGGKLAEYTVDRRECPIREKMLSKKDGSVVFDCHYRQAIGPGTAFYELFLVFPYRIESYEENIFDVYKYSQKGPRFIMEICGEGIFPWDDKEKLLKKLKTYTVVS